MIPYFDLTRQYQTLQAELEPALLAAARSGKYVLGDEVGKFENAFARYAGTKHAVGVGSGTDALIFSLKALGIGKGNEVVVPSFTFVATVFAILHAGARPVFADVDPVTYTLDPASVDRVLTKRTRAVLPVHLYGQTADMDALLQIAHRKKLKVVEDACQAHGADWKGKKAGSMGDAGCFSFYPTKNLGAVGDGGMAITSKDVLGQKIRSLRNLGRVELKDPHRDLGWTSRLDALQAAVLNIKLKYLDHFNDCRRRIAARYVQNLASTPLLLPQEGTRRRHVYHLFVVRVPDKKREALRKMLQENGVTTMIHYPIPVHRQPACRGLAKKPVPLPVTEKISGEILSLPLFPEMRDDEADRVCALIRQFYS